MNFYFFSPLILQKLIWLPTRFIFFAFGRLKVQGLNNLKLVKGPVIFACNHVSEADPVLVPASLPFLSRFSPIFYAAREKSFYKNSGWRRHFFGGLIFNTWGAHAIETGLKDYEKSLSRHINIIRAGGSLCFFPEGKISRNGEVQEVRGGISYLAFRTNCLIVPVAISGVTALSFADFFLFRRRFVVSFGSPITQEELQAKVGRNAKVGTQLGIQLGDNIYKKQAEYVMKKVREMLQNQPSHSPTYTQILDKVSV